MSRRDDVAAHTQSQRFTVEGDPSDVIALAEQQGWKITRPHSIWLRRLNRLMTPALGAAAVLNFEHGRYWFGGFVVLICIARSWDA